MTSYPMLPPGPERDTRGTNLRELWTGFRRQKRAILASVVLTLAAAAVFLIVFRPVYQSDATLRIVAQDDKSELIAALPSLADLALPGMAGDVVDTEMGVLRSRRIADHVISELGLQVRVRGTDQPRDRLIRVLAVERDTAEIAVTLRRQDDGAYAFDYQRQRHVVTPGEPFTLGPAELALAPALRSSGPGKIRLAIDPYHETLKAFRKTLDVDKQEGRSELIEVVYRSKDPVLAAGVVESAVRAFVEYKEATDQSDLRRRVAALTSQVEQYRGDLARAEEELRRYREAHGIVEPEEQAAEQVKMAALVQSEREAAVIERDALRATMAELQRDRPAGEMARQLAAFPTFIANRGVQELAAHLTNAEEARSQLLVRRTRENDDVRRVEERIDELELQLYRHAAAYLASLQNQITAADRSLARFGAVARQIPATEMQYARLFREQRLLNEVYLTLQGRLEEARVQLATAPEEVRVIDAPIVPVEPAWPKPAVTLVLAGFLGLMIGLMVSVGREAVDTSVRTRDEVEFVSGLPVVAMIPHSRARRDERRAFAGGLLRLPARISSRPLHDGPPLLAAGGDHPELAEAFRGLPASLGAATVGAGTQQVVLLTSPTAGEGKSLSATNLAVVLAQRGLRTLLVDADLRGGQLHQLVRVPGTPGLSDLLKTGGVTEAAIHRIELEGVSHLDLLPAGSVIADPAERLASTDAAHLFDDLRSRYDRIVVDAPDVLRYADAATLAKLADSVLLVVRSGYTDRDDLRHSAVRFSRVGVHVTGVILNDVGF